MSNKKQQLVDNILDLIAMLDKGDQFATKQQAITLAEEFSDSYTGSPLDLYLIAKRVENVASAILTKDLKEAGYTEFTLRYGEEKAEHRGNEITPVCGYKKYEYPDDEYINKVEKDLEQVEKQMKPLKDKQKSIKNSIKARQKELEEAGKATLISQTKTLRG